MSTGIDMLLVNCPRDITSFNKIDSHDKRMPLGIMYIASYLKSKGFTVKILDAEALSLGISDITNFTNQINPRIVGLNCHTLNRQVVYEIAKSLKILHNEMLVVLGGPHPTLAPKDTLEECPLIDAVVVGEGERTVHEICLRTEQLDKIPGIAFTPLY